LLANSPQSPKMKQSSASRNFADSKSPAHHTVPSPQKTGKSFFAVKDFTVHQPSPQAMQQKEEQTVAANESAQPVQRMKVEAESSVNKKLGENEKNKVNVLIGIMNSALEGLLNEDDTIYIEIINNGEMSPAWNHHKGTKEHPGRIGDIGVQLNSWYIEKASVGELLGMFVHEIGVHTLADRQMGYDDPNKGPQKGTNIYSERVSQGYDHTHKLGHEIGYYPTPDEKNKKGRSRQADHVNLAKSLAGSVSDRGKYYIDTYLRTGDSISKNIENPKEREAVLFDLTRYFLFDISRIIATNDGPPLDILRNTKKIGELMEYYKHDLAEDHKEDHPWLEEAVMSVNTKASTITKWLLSQLASLVTSSNPAVQKGRAALTGLGAAYIVGGSLAGIISTPALLTGIGVGLGVWGVQKLFGV
jgi:hypothetical protein